MVVQKSMLSYCLIYQQTCITDILSLGRQCKTQNSSLLQKQSDQDLHNLVVIYDLLHRHYNIVQWTNSNNGEELKCLIAQKIQTDRPDQPADGEV